MANVSDEFSPFMHLLRDSKPGDLQLRRRMIVGDTFVDFVLRPTPGSVMTFDEQLRPTIQSLAEFANYQAMVEVPNDATRLFLDNTHVRNGTRVFVVETGKYWDVVDVDALPGAAGFIPVAQTASDIGAASATDLTAEANTREAADALIRNTGNLVWVDAVNGVDATALRGRRDRPFLTLLAAQTAASSGDSIMVLPGSYTGYALGKSGVNYVFSPGCTVTANAGGDNGIFDAVSSAKIFSVFGYPNLVDTGYQGIAVYVGAGSQIYMELGDVTTGSGDIDQSFTLNGGSGTIIVKGTVRNANYDAFVITGGTWDITVQDIEVSGNCFELVASSGFTTFRVLGNAISTGNNGIGDAGSSAIAWGGGDAHVSGRFRSLNDDAACVIASTSVGTLRLVSANLKSDAAQAGIRLMASFSATLVIDSAVIVAGGTNSIAGTGTVKVLNAFSNKPVAGTITQQVGTVIVNSNVA